MKKLLFILKLKAMKIKKSLNNKAVNKYEQIEISLWFDLLIIKQVVSK